MSDIFISYSSEDRNRILPLVKALEKTGWSVFWDRTISTGKTWRQVIGSEIRTCRSVLVVWTENSVTSGWVEEEAEIGKRRRTLIPVLLDDVEPPFGLSSIQTANLSDWNGDSSSPPFARLVTDIAAILGPAPAATKAEEYRLRGRQRAEKEAREKAEEENRRRVEQERNRAERKLEQQRLQAEAERKTEEERLREQERQRFEEEARRKANEESERNRAQGRPQVMTYDVFISFKNLDENGVPTRDAELANEVYEFLKAKGLKVFISTATLESLGVSDYTKAINDALDAASIVVAVGTSAENLDSEWVRYEWGSFYNDILSRQKPGGKVFTYILGLRPAQLPRTLRQTQTFIHSPQSLGQLHGFIVRALSEE